MYVNQTVMLYSLSLYSEVVGYFSIELGRGGEGRGAVVRCVPGMKGL